jgi:hypothetical protein
MKGTPVEGECQVHYIERKSPQREPGATFILQINLITTVFLLTALS